METKEIMKEAAKTLIKKAWITEELYAPIIYGTINDVFNKEKPEHSDLLRDLGASCECGRKTFSPFNTWVVTLQYDPVLQGTFIWLSVNSENCKEKICISAHGVIPYWERLLGILMKFEDSWHEKAEFIFESLEVFNQRAKSKDPLIAKILDQVATKIMVQYDKLEEMEEGLRALEEKNKESAERLVGFLRFLRQISEKLEETKRWFKSKKIAGIREEIEKKIMEILAGGEDVEMLRSWTEEWASKQRIKRMMDCIVDK